MSDKQIKIVLTADGKEYAVEIDKASGKTKQLDNDSKKLNKTFGSQRQELAALKAAFIAYGGVILTRKVVNSIDTYARLNGQLRLVTDSTEELTFIQGKLFEIAQQTRSEYEATVTLYRRVAQNADALNLSQSQLLAITRATNQAIQVGGQSAQEAAAGVIQFSQALASGELRGDEFRSIMENMPRLARAIADGLEVDIGALRAMSQEGELTARKVTDALLAQKETIEEEFRLLEVTSASMLTTIGNSLERSIAQADAGPLVDSLIELRETLDDPQTIKSIETFASATVTSLSSIVTMGSLTIDKVQEVSEKIARLVGGFDAGAGQFFDLDSEELIEKSKEIRDQIVAIYNDPKNRAHDGDLIFDAKTRLAALEAQLGQVAVLYDLASDKAKTVTPDPNQVDASNAALSRTNKEVETYINNLERQVGLVGLNQVEAAQYEARLRGATDAQVKQVGAMVTFMQASKELTAHLEKEQATRIKLQQDLEKSLEGQTRLWAEASQHIGGLEEKGVDAYESLERAVRGYGNRAADAFIRIPGEGADAFGDMVTSMVQDLIRLQAQKHIFGPLLEFGTAAFSSLLASGSTASIISSSPTSISVGSPTTFANVAHTGGIGKHLKQGRSVPAEIFDYAPRFHSGRLPGLDSTEMPAIIRKDEGVFTPEQMKALGSPNIDIKIEIINEDGPAMQGQVTGVRQQGNQQFIQMRIKQVVNEGFGNGAFDQSMKNNFGISRNAVPRS